MKELFLYDEVYIVKHGCRKIVESQFVIMLSLCSYSIRKSAGQLSCSCLLLYCSRNSSNPINSRWWSNWYLIYSSRNSLVMFPGWQRIFFIFFCARRRRSGWRQRFWLSASRRAVSWGVETAICCASPRLSDPSMTIWASSGVNSPTAILALSFLLTTFSAKSFPVFRLFMWMTRAYAPSPRMVPNLNFPISILLQQRNKHQDKLVMWRPKRLLSYLFPVGVLGGLDGAFFAAGDGDKSAMTRWESCGQTKTTTKTNRKRTKMPW